MNDGCVTTGMLSQSCLTLVTPYTIARQVPLSTGFFRREYWSGLPFPPPGDLPWPRNWTHVSYIFCTRDRFFTTAPHGKPPRNFTLRELRPIWHHAPIFQFLDNLSYLSWSLSTSTYHYQDYILKLAITGLYPSSLLITPNITILLPPQYFQFTVPLLFYNPSTFFFFFFHFSLYPAEVIFQQNSCQYPKLSLSCGLSYMAKHQSWMNPTLCALCAYICTVIFLAFQQLFQTFSMLPESQTTKFQSPNFNQSHDNTSKEHKGVRWELLQIAIAK